MRIVTRPIAKASVVSRLTSTTYLSTHVASGQSTGTSVALDRIDGGNNALVFLPNTSVTLRILASFSARVSSAYNHSIEKLINIWVNELGVPTITYTVTVSGSYDGLTVQTQLDSKSNQYVLILSMFGWGAGIMTFGNAVITAVTTVR